MPSQASWSRSSSGSAGRRIRAELRACIPRSDVQLPDLEDAEFSASICAGDNFSVAALTRSPSCSGFEALAIGAVTLGRAINQASATCVGVATVALATSSRTASVAKFVFSTIVIVVAVYWVWFMFAHADQIFRRRSVDRSPGTIALTATHE